MNDSAPVLSYQGMTKRYGPLTAVDGLLLSVNRGEMFGLIGPDGAGKTTSLRVGLGLLRPDAGSVTTCGLTPHKRRRRLADRVGYLSQRFSLYGDLSVDENIAFFARIHGVKGWRPRREELLDLVRMEPFRKRLADRLSGGMKQKLALACTLIHQPELLVLDEPTTGVDPVSRRDFWRLLARLQRDGLTIVMTTPYLDEAERCQRVGLMHKGRLLTMGDPQALRREYSGRMVEVVAHPPRDAAAVLRDDPAVAGVEIFGERLHAELAGAGFNQTVFEASQEGAAAKQRAPDGPLEQPAEGGDAALETLCGALKEKLNARGITVHACRPIIPSLEDVFISRIRAAESEEVVTCPAENGNGAR